MSDKTKTSQPNERAQQLLKVLVESYILDGQPVGSRTLSEESGLNVSPATVRNVMADLERMGLICSPHTSAGRIPTVKGYRLFVDNLLTVKPLASQEVTHLRNELAGGGGTSKALMGQVSNILSGLTTLAGVVTVSSRQQAALKQIEFVTLSSRRVLAVLVYADNEIQNRILETRCDFKPSVLQQAANFLTAQLAGKNLSEVRDALVGELGQNHKEMSEMMQAVVSMASNMVDEENASEDLLLSGEINLMGVDELSNVEKLKALFEAFNTKRDILHLLDSCIDASGVQIYIGEESGYQVLDGCSVVTAPYKIEDQVLGVLGVIGPTRMAYERVIPIVDMTARLLSSALNSKN